MKSFFSIKDYEWSPPPDDIKGDKEAVKRHCNKVRAKIYRDHIQDSVLGPL